ncbi:unnamed protein product [Laminaria digitata]
MIPSPGCRPSNSPRDPVSSKEPASNTISQQCIALLSVVIPHWAPVMILQTARMIVSEFMHVVNPWRHAAVGSQVLVNPGAFGLGLSGSDDHEREELFGPLWFAVPKKRVPIGKKRTRTADRTPKRITHYSMCTKCGQPKLNHKFCDNIELCAKDETTVQAER